jgi:radical SAM superfamily enzyme YgiQ (UPF0313 family)
MKILIIFPRLEEHKDYHYMPISALCVASKLLADGHKVKIHDERIKPLEKFDTEWPNKIMITAYTGFQIADAYRLVKVIRHKYWVSKKIILGGPHATIFGQSCVEKGMIDDVWTGYAERGEFDMPWNLIADNINDYINPKTERFIYISSYSCPGQCTFCAQKTRRELCFLPLDKVERDIDNLMKLYPFKECVMFDATLFTKPERLREISRILGNHDLKWICDSRADEVCKITPNIMNGVIAHGLKQLTVGLESGSQRIIEIMNKGTNYLQQFKLAAKFLSIFDIKLVSGVIFGCPGETPDDLLQTIDYIKEIKSINPNFYISTTFYKPLPDTKMSDMCKPYGYTEPDTLEGWAERGAEGHYQYNAWDDAPWIENKSEYKAIYDEFIQNNKELLV